MRDAMLPVRATREETASEAARLRVLHGYAILDTPEEAAFDDLTALAAEVCGTPIALISLVDADRQWFKAHFGLDTCSTDRASSFCAHAIPPWAGRPSQPARTNSQETGGDGLLIVPDATLDPRFERNQLVVGAPFIQFYAGAPLTTEDGHTLGTLCVLDTVPRTLTALQRSQLTRLSNQVMSQLLLRRRTAELTAERRLLNGVLEATDSLIYAKDLDGRFLLANRALHEMAGLADGEMLGVTDYDLFPALAADGFRQNDVEIAHTGVTRSFTELLPHRDGRTHSFQSTKFALRDESGAVYAVASASTDVTDLEERIDQLGALEQRWRELFDRSPVGIGLTDENERLVAVNPALCVLLGRTEAEVVGHTDTDFNHPDDLGQQLAAHARLRSTPGVVQLEKRYLRPDGTVRWAWLTSTLVSGPDGQTWRLAHVQDITERRAAEQLVVDSEANLTAVAQVVKTISSGRDARQVVVSAAADLARAASVSLIERSEDAATLRVSASSDPALVDTVIPFESATADVFFTGRPLFLADPASNRRIVPSLLALSDVRSLYSVPVRSGEEVTAVLTVAWNHRVADLDDRNASVVTLLADQAGVALHQAALLTELRAMAATDPLTGLANRRNWDRAIARMVRSADRSGHPLTVALADLDHFKRYNDEFGHPAGDALLRDFAATVPSAMRADDLVARWGGEEFALALPNCSDSEAVAVLARVLGAVPGQQTCSIGYATWDGVETPDQLLARADAALYDAKHTGRNRLCPA